jgi:hypothetical protein
MKMKTKNLFLTALVLTSASYAKTWNQYRAQFEDQNTMSGKVVESNARVSTLIKKLGQDGVAARAVTRTQLTDAELKAASVSENRVRSSDFMKKVMLPAILELHKDYKTGKGQTFDADQFDSDVQKGIDDRRFESCKNAVGEKTLKRVVDDFFNTVVDLDKQERDGKGVRIEKDADVSEAAKSVARKIQKYLDEQQPGLRDSLGHVFGVKVVDGLVRNIYFTERADVTIDRPKTLTESDMSNITLSMLSSFRTGEDFAFILSHDCLLRVMDDETAALEKSLVDMTTGRTSAVKRHWYSTEIQKARVRLADLARMRNYMKAKKLGAAEVSRRLQRMGNELPKLMTLFLNFPGSNVPVASEYNTMQVALMKLTGANGEVSEADRDFDYYQALHTEMTRLEKYLDQEAGHQKVIEQSIERMKELK